MKGTIYAETRYYISCGRCFTRELLTEAESEKDTEKVATVYRAWVKSDEYGWLCPRCAKELRGK